MGPFATPLDFDAAKRPPSPSEQCWGPPAAARGTRARCALSQLPHHRADGVVFAGQWAPVAQAGPVGGGGEGLHTPQSPLRLRLAGLTRSVFVAITASRRGLGRGCVVPVEIHGASVR